MNPGKFPDDIKPFYDKPETPSDTPEGEDGKADDAGDKKAKGKKKEEKGKKKKGKKAKGDDDGAGDSVKIGPSETV